jgi:hypothetical protein
MEWPQLDWHEYARTFGKCYVSMSAIMPETWTVYLPDGEILVGTLDHVREAAAEQGCTILL